MPHGFPVFPIRVRDKVLEAGVKSLPELAGSKVTGWNYCTCMNIRMPTPLPDYPWQKVGSDLFELNGKPYLITVDYFSRYPEVTTLSSTSSLSVITALKSSFARYGIPEIVATDNGPQFSSQEFKLFAREYNFHHQTSSPHFPQSNGQVERGVKTVKKLLKDAKDPHLSLLAYRSTPLPWCKLSPAELLMGRNIRSNIPQVQETQWPYLTEFRHTNDLFKSQQKVNYDKRHRTQPLPDIPDDAEETNLLDMSPDQQVPLDPIW